MINSNIRPAAAYSVQKSDPIIPCSTSITIFGIVYNFSYILKVIDLFDILTQ